MIKKYLIFVSFIIPVIIGCEKRAEREKIITDYTVFVDPMIGTDAHGHTYPGATLPFGMVQVSPDNGKEGWDWSSGYHYSSDTIAGFSHTHLSGTGVGDLLDIMVTPTTLPVPIRPGDSTGPDIRNYYSTFSHENEESSPGYYSVFLEEPRIQAEFTATERTAMHRYTPEESGILSLLIDLGFAVNYDSVYQSHIKYISDTLISGFRFSTGWAEDQKVFFAMRFSEPIDVFKLYSPDSLILGDTLSIQAGRVKGVFKFDMPENRSLHVKTGVSGTSEENALINLNYEIPEWNFNAIRQSASEKWNRELSKIKITSDNDTLMRIFYTALYHSMLAPNIYSDSLRNNSFEYRSPNDEIISSKNFNNYYTFSLWDTYRAEHPLFTILHPGKVQNFVKAMMAHYHDTGLLPVWTLWGNETNTMIGYHSVPVIVDAYLKGLLPDIDPDSIYKALLASAYQDIREVPIYREYGYIPADTLANTVSKTLEYAFDDWCIAQMARSLGNTEDYETFMKRAGYYKNLFDPGTLFMRPKLANGEWKTPFDPLDTRYNNDYTEGNAWQYTWYVPHDVNNLITLMGGQAQFNKKLDSLFNIPSDPGDDAALDVTGMIGQYVHGNEPSHHIAYLYNYSGQAWKAQEKIHEIRSALYSDQPDGLCGNEDCGQLSAWYIFSALGFYPVNPANGKYDLGIPLFKKAVINLPGNKTFTISAENFSPENKYVKSISINNRLLDGITVSHEQIMKGGTLVFELTDKP